MYPLSTCAPAVTSVTRARVARGAVVPAASVVVCQASAVVTYGLPSPTGRGPPAAVPLPETTARAKP